METKRSRLLMYRDFFVAMLNSLVRIFATQTHTDCQDASRPSLVGRLGQGAIQPQERKVSSVAYAFADVRIFPNGSATNEQHYPNND